MRKVVRLTSRRAEIEIYLALNLKLRKASSAVTLAGVPSAQPKPMRILKTAHHQTSFPFPVRFDYLFIYTNKPKNMYRTPHCARFLEEYATDHQDSHTNVFLTSEQQLSVCVSLSLRVINHAAHFIRSRCFSYQTPSTAMTH